MNLSFTIITNYLGLIIAVWLGWYVITRSPKQLISWLTSLTIWSVGGLFLNMVLALNPPSAPIQSPDWFRVLYPFWPSEAFESGWVGWLQGWQVTPAIVLWHHVTMLMRPGKMNVWRWSRVIFGYAAALGVIWVQIFRPLLFADVSGDPLYLDTKLPGPLFIPILLLLVIFSLFSIFNLINTSRATEDSISKRQLTTLTIATLIAGITGPIAILATTYDLALPQISITILLIFSLILIGYGVAQYSALIEGRTIRRDFIFNAIAMGLVTLVYSSVTWISIVIYGIPAAAFVFIILLAIFTHNLVDVARHSMDTKIFRTENQLLRSNFRRLESTLGEISVNERISSELGGICTSVRATYAVLLLFKDKEIIDHISHNKSIDNFSLPIETFLIDDVTHLQPNVLPHPLNDASLFIPLYADTIQTGLIILGRPVNSTNFSESDVDLILYPSDRLAEIIRDTRKEEEYLSNLSQLTVPKDDQKSSITVKDVETSLRYIYNYAHLGDSMLVSLKLVKIRLSESDVTHLDQGKAVSSVIAEALEKLRPDTGSPSDPPPREWHPYLILHEAYLENKLNRDIMSRLYISEGTFNRTRRSAIRTLTRVIEEMEKSQP